MAAHLPKRLESARLILRQWTLDDVALLVALDSDPAVMRYINGGRPTAASAVQSSILKSPDDRWLAFERFGGEFVGWFALTQADYELGYRLRREKWGTGLATEGSMSLIRTAFDSLGADRVWAQTMTVNIASRRVMEKCGLTYVRTFSLEWPEAIEGSEFGDVEYELRRGERPG